MIARFGWSVVLCVVMTSPAAAQTAPRPDANRHVGQKARLNAFRTADRVVASARVTAPPSRVGLAGESACTVDGIMIGAACKAIESRIGMEAG